MLTMFLIDNLYNKVSLKNIAIDWIQVFEGKEKTCFLFLMGIKKDILARISFLQFRFQ